MMAKNSFIGWCLKKPGGRITQAVYWSKSDAIDFITGISSESLFETHKRCARWREAYKNGWRVVPVLVTEIKKKDKTGREAGEK